MPSDHLPKYDSDGSPNSTIVAMPFSAADRPTIGYSRRPAAERAICIEARSSTTL